MTIDLGLCIAIATTVVLLAGAFKRAVFGAPAVKPISWCKGGHVYYPERLRTPYCAVERGPIDGIGREHAEVMVECFLCKKPFPLLSVHLPERHAERLLKEENIKLRKTLSQFMEGL